MTRTERTARVCAVVACNRRKSAPYLKALEQAGYAVIAEDDSDAIHDLALILYTDNPERLPAVCEELRRRHTNRFTPLLLVLLVKTPANTAQACLPFVDMVLNHTTSPAEMLLNVRSLLNMKARFASLTAENEQIAAKLAARNQELDKALRDLETVNLIKTTLVDNVKHELRTRVLQVKSAVALLQEGVPRSPEDAELLEMADQAIRLLENTVLDITQVAEIQSTGRQPTIFKESVTLALRTLERTLKPENMARITVEIPDALPLVVGDQRGIAQLLQYLIHNALKFSPADSPVELRACLIEGMRLRVSVKDYGIGIPPDQHQNIFKAFYQIDPSSKRKYGGVGVGLTLAQMLAEGMGTRIELTSTVGKGSEFFFKLPCYQFAED
ncbi:MAG: hypothetical protein Kow0077_04750 [Anaerolineae bacterium]